MTPEQRARDDRRRHVKALLALLGLAGTLGSVFGACWGMGHLALDYWTAGEVEAE